MKLRTCDLHFGFIICSPVVSLWSDDPTFWLDELLYICTIGQQLAPSESKALYLHLIM